MRTTLNMGKKSGKKERDELQEIETLRKGILQAKAKGDYKEVANLHNQLGYIYRVREEYDEAIEQHKEEARVTRDKFPKDKIGLAVAYRNIGEVYIDMKREDTAIEFIQRYLKLAKHERHLLEEQRAHITLGRICLGLVDRYTDNEVNDPEASKKRSEELSNAQRQFTRAHEILAEPELKNQVKERELAEMRCGTYLNLGITFDLADKADEAINWIEKSIAVARTFGFGDSLHRSYSCLYATYTKLEKYNDAYNTAKLIHKTSKLLGKKSVEFEARFLEAKALFLLNEIEKGINILKRIRKQIMRTESVKYMLDEIDPVLTSAIRIFNADDDQIAADEHDLYKLKSLFEIKGDNYVTLGCLQEATKNYLQSISHAEKLGLTGKQLGALYYSLGVTYKDCGDYENALRYFKKEMKIFKGNKLEEFRTQTNIADCLETAKKPTEMVLEAYQAAVKLSEDFPRRKVTSLKSLAQYYKVIGDTETSEKLFRKAQKLEDTLKLSTAGNSDEDDSQELLLEEEDPIDLDNLSGGESDTEEEEEGGNVPKNTVLVQKPTKFRKNEKGETPLHIAAQKGDLKSVRRLIATGHEVNPRDYSGWIPLHEACNFGHLEVVKELLKHKADVNYSGGAVCEGVTPIHDAASNGHIAVMDALLQYGASAVIRDKQGNRPVDSLVGWFERERKSGGLTEEKIDEYNEMKKRLVDLMERSGRTYTKKDEQIAKRKATDRRTPSPVYSLMKTDNMDDPVPVTIKVVDPDENEGRAGVSEYNEAMSMFRRKETSKYRSERNEPSTSKKAKKDALLEESQYIDGDWMIPDENLAPDVLKSKRKRDPFDDLKLADRSIRRKREGKRNAVAQMDIVRDFRPPVECISCGESDNEVIMEDSQDYSNNSPELNCDSQNLNSIFDPSDFSSSERVRDPEPIIDSYESDDDDFRPSKPHHMDSPLLVDLTLSRRQRQTKLPFKRVSSESMKKTPSNSNLRERSPSPTIGNFKSLARHSLNKSRSQESLKSQDSTNQQTLRLKIEILNKKILVPVVQLDETIDWLCQEAADRFYKDFGNGLRAKLALKTKDGASLSGTDRIRDAISAVDNELIATVEECTMEDAGKRFESACKKLNIDANADVVRALVRSQTTDGLILTDICLRGKINEALFQTLQHHCLLRELNLAGCSLRDEGVKRLCSVIHTLSALEKLDISCNALTHESVGKLSEALSKSATPGQSFKPPLGIKFLILDHNPLGNSITCSLFQIISRQQNLLLVSIIDCNLTAGFFSKNRKDLISVINDSGISVLNISYNHLGKGGVQILQTEINRPEVITTCCE